MGAVRELEQAKQSRQAETLLRRVLIDAPRCPEAHRAIARHLVQNNHAAAAGEHLEIAAAIAGLGPDLALQIASTLRAQAKIPEAITAAATALLLNQQNVHAYVTLAVALEADGRLEEASTVIADADQRFGEHALPMRRIAAIVFAAKKDYERALVRLAYDELAPIELFERGLILEKLGRYPEAWRDWMTAKQIQRERDGCVYPADQVAREFADLFEMARPPRTEYLHAAHPIPRRPWPIFITGFPRSGTTMIEAALSAHPRIAAGDELPFIPDLLARVPAWLNARAPYPRAMMAAAMPENHGVGAIMAQWYIGRAVHKIGDVGRDVAYFTDKMPSNEMHVPFLRLLFPEAPIIHVRRHPLDIIVSNMSRWLVHGRFNACALESCATHYALTDELIAHYRAKLPDARIHEIRYEQFVADHRAEIDRALPSDLAPDPACYDFHLNPWHSRTISHRQVKEPVHDKSVGRYQNFIDFLRPIVPTIAPTLEREGYAI